MPKVSIVTPIYNSEEYLEECLYSVISQTLRDIEIILIDDGSTDSSPEICDKYAAIDKRIKVVHKENAGMGVSYNLGMDMAQGEYIGFVESDDYIDENMFEALYSIAQKYKPDIVKSQWFDFYEKIDSVKKSQQFANFNSYQVINPQDYSWILRQQCTVWSAIYKTSYIREKNVRYLESPGASYQDVGFTFKAFTSADSMVITPDAYYYYRRDNENSSINSKEKAEVIFWEYEEVDRFFDEHPEIKSWANYDKLAQQYFHYQWNYNRIAPQFRPAFLKHFAKDFKKYMDNGELDPQFTSSVNMNFLELIMSLV